MNKSQYNKPLILKEKDIDASKSNIKKGSKVKNSTPKYMQINLKRNNFLSLSDNFANGEKKPSRNKNKEHRDKSSNVSKPGKFCIEIAKITDSNKSRGVSADELMEVDSKKELEKQSKTTKASRSKLIKVSLSDFP